MCWCNQATSSTVRPTGGAGLSDPLLRQHDPRTVLLRYKPLSNSDVAKFADAYTKDHPEQSN